MFPIDFHEVEAFERSEKYFDGIFHLSIKIIGFPCVLRIFISDVIETQLIARGLCLFQKLANDWSWNCFN